MLMQRSEERDWLQSSPETLAPLEQHTAHVNHGRLAQDSLLTCFMARHNVEGLSCWDIVGDTGEGSDVAGERVQAAGACQFGMDIRDAGAVR